LWTLSRSTLEIVTDEVRNVAVDPDLGFFAFRNDSQV
jgi:hypothetical protein